MSSDSEGKTLQKTGINTSLSKITFELVVEYKKKQIKLVIMKSFVKKLRASAAELTLLSHGT